MHGSCDAIVMYHDFFWVIIDVRGVKPKIHRPFARAFFFNTERGNDSLKRIVIEEPTLQLQHPSSRIPLWVRDLPVLKYSDNIINIIRNTLRQSHGTLP
jgi:hypothetical protein